MSSEGNRNAIGVPFNNRKGHVRVYELVDGNWIQAGGDADGKAADDEFGYSIATCHWMAAESLSGPIEML